MEDRRLACPDRRGRLSSTGRDRLRRSSGDSFEFDSSTPVSVPPDGVVGAGATVDVIGNTEAFVVVKKPWTYLYPIMPAPATAATNARIATAAMSTKELFFFWTGGGAGGTIGAGCVTGCTNGALPGAVTCVAGTTVFAAATVSAPTIAVGVEAAPGAALLRVARLAVTLRTFCFARYSSRSAMSSLQV